MGVSVMGSVVMEEVEEMFKGREGGRVIYPS